MAATQSPAVENPLQSSGKRPRGWAKINGQYCQALKFSVCSKRHLAANTFSLSLEDWQQPQGFGFKYWANDAPGGVTVELLAGFLDPSQDVSALPSNPTSLILGVADDMTCDPLTGVLTITGRDMTSKLIDQKTSNRWPQHTSADIVKQLAQQAGLNVQVKSSSTPAGEYYRTAYGQLARSLPMWDMIAFLARNEGVDAYVQGNTLYFQPPQGDSGGPLKIVIGRDANGVIQCNAEPIKFHRKLTLAQNLSIDVKSHHTAKGQSIKANATRAAKGTNGSGTQAYSISRPNKSQAQAQQIANNMLGELVQHEMGFSATLDADLTFTVFRQAQISGSGTAFDTLYDVATLTFDWDSGANGGLKMSIDAKLAAPAGQAATPSPLASASANKAADSGSGNYETSVATGETVEGSPVIQQNAAVF